MAFFISSHFYSYLYSYFSPFPFLSSHDFVFYTSLKVVASVLLGYCLFVYFALVFFLIYFEITVIVFESFVIAVGIAIIVFDSIGIGITVGVVVIVLRLVVVIVLRIDVIV